MFKCAVLIGPIIALYLITTAFYSTQEGDLTRVGYIAKDTEYRKVFHEEFRRPKYYVALDSVAIPHSEISVLIIGDSFSNQGNFGYHNYLAEHDSIHVSYSRFDHHTSNPIQALYDVTKGDLFDKVSFDYVILQSVERIFIRRSRNLSMNNTLNLSGILKSEFSKKTKATNVHPFPSREIINFPLYNLLYPLKDNAYLSKVYRVELKQPMFSGKRRSELIFLEDDLLYLGVNNDTSTMLMFNDKLNTIARQLKAKGTKLVVLPGVDKYDLYYDYINNKDAYSKPLFFDHWAPLRKDYIWINSKEILRGAIPAKPDIYFYDDTHWSPWGAQLIAHELAVRILKDHQGRDQ